MKDRTIILFALLFLFLTISTGVNKALEAANQMTGRQMAPSLKQIYTKVMDN